MLRIKEAIQRKKMIHEMNEEWREIEYDIGLGPSSLSVANPARCPSPMLRNQFSICGTSRIGGGPANDDATGEEPETRLHNFVIYLSGKLTDLQKRALKITWKRLSEAPKTSGRGTLHIMEKVLTKLCDQSPGVTAIFYKSAFLSCIEDRKCGRVQQSSIATIRDHAHILITLIDDILRTMFEGPLECVKYDPDTIGEAHSRLGPLGFERSIWHTFGECFAEVMFMQECIRAYPHAPSAWSLLAVALTDRIFSATKMSTSRSMTRPDQHQYQQQDGSSSIIPPPPLPPPPVPPRRNSTKCPFFPSTSSAPSASSSTSFMSLSSSTATHKRSLPSTAQLARIQPTSVLSLDLDNIPTNNEDDEVFVTARTHFDPPSASSIPPIPPQRRLPSLAMTTSACDERMFCNGENERKYSELQNSRGMVPSKFIRSKSEARIRVKRQNQTLNGCGGGRQGLNGYRSQGSTDV